MPAYEEPPVLPGGSFLLNDVQRFFNYKCAVEINLNCVLSGDAGSDGEIQMAVLTAVVPQLPPGNCCNLGQVSKNIAFAVSDYKHHINVVSGIVGPFRAVEHHGDLCTNVMGRCVGIICHILVGPVFSVRCGAKACTDFGSLQAIVGKDGCIRCVVSIATAKKQRNRLLPEPSDGNQPPEWYSR